MLLCFLWNIFDIYIQMLSDNLSKYNGMILNSPCIVKHRPLMYTKKCEKTFEILRSEITF